MIKKRFAFLLALAMTFSAISPVSAYAQEMDMPERIAGEAAVGEEESADAAASEAVRSEEPEKEEKAEPAREEGTEPEAVESGAVQETAESSETEANSSKPELSGITAEETEGGSPAADMAADSTASDGTASDGTETAAAAEDMVLPVSEELLSQTENTGLTVTSWKLGNESSYILNGGDILRNGDELIYFDPEQGSLWSVSGDQEPEYIADLCGGNLNLLNGHLYYNVGAAIYRMEQGGSPVCIFNGTEPIRQMYVVNEEVVYYLTDSGIYGWQIGSEAALCVREQTGIAGFVPTEFGMVYSLGELFSRTVYAGENAAVSGVLSFYVEDDYLYYSTQDRDCKESVPGLFGIRTADAGVVYSLGEEVTEADFCSENGICEVCEENARLLAAGELEMEAVDEAPQEVDAISAYATAASKGVQNIVKRARQMHEIEWVPLKDMASYEGTPIFEEGVTYHGIPYGQPYQTSSYVPWDCSLDKFLKETLDSASKFNTSTSVNGAPYYSSDCSAFVSWAWQTDSRWVTGYWSQMSSSVKLSTQSFYSAQVGDAICKGGRHVVLISDMGFDSSGNLIYVDILEQTPPKTKHTRYGVGGTYPLAKLYSKYLDNGYTLYRNKNRDSVTYTHSCAVPLDGDYCSSTCKKNIGVSFDQKDYYVLEGDTITLQVTNNTGKTPTWSLASNLGNSTTVAEIVSTGSSGTTCVVKGNQSYSSVNVQVKAGAYTTSCTVHVVEYMDKDYATELPEDADARRELIIAFVTRLYQNILGRKPDADGLNDWVWKLESKQKTGADVVVGFFHSNEFLKKNRTDSDFVTILYKTIFNRNPDTAGKNSWLTVLENGQSRDFVISGFIGSDEFTNMCNRYGIARGSFTSSEIVDKNPKVTAFVTRLYTVCLERKPDKAGLYDWVEQLLNKESTGKIIVRGFLLSDEMWEKDLSNAEFIEYCYQAMFNRAGDSAGKADWLSRMEDGYTRSNVVNGFVGSQEFLKLCAKYGIEAR